MKKLLLFLPFLLLLSCSVQKRKYQKGFYVDWHQNKTKQETLAKKTEKPVPAKKYNEPAEFSQNNDTNLPGIARTIQPAKEPVKALISAKAEGDSCDVLVFKDGSEIKGKILEVGATEIKYKRCDTPDGPTYISRKSELFMIKYANGTREVVKSEAQPERQVQTTVQKPNLNKQRHMPRQVPPMAIAAMVLGILSIVFAYVGLIAAGLALAGFGYLFLVSFLASLGGVITGSSARRLINEQPDVFKGRGFATTGFIMSMIMLGIYAIVATVLFLAFVLFI